MTGFERVTEALESAGLIESRGYDGRVMARCPAHNDSRASLSVAEGDEGNALIYCHAGCDTKYVVKALDINMSDLFTIPGGVVVSQYFYTDEQGEPLYRVLRTEDKTFSQERFEDGVYVPGLKETRRVLYRLPEVLAAAKKGETVYFVEGEKDADNLVASGATASSLSGGANARWDPSYSSALAGAEVVVIADADEPGRLHAQKVQAGLGGLAEIVLPAVGKDVTDHLNAGKMLSELVPLGNAELEVFEPFDWQSYQVPENEWLFEPYVPRAARVLAYGPKGSLKSLWAMWLGAKIAREGGKVGYFSLEMPKSAVAKRMQRLNPGKNLQVFSAFMMGQNLETAIKNFEGWDLLIIDSWSAAQGNMGGNDNDAVAMMDRDFFMPLIQATGATLLLIDNTGNPALTDAGKVKPDWARGASAKGDKMEVELWFDRPVEDNNFRVKIACKKMRLDTAMPPVAVIETPQDDIEFYYVDSTTGSMTQGMWPGTPSYVAPVMAAPSAEFTAAPNNVGEGDDAAPGQSLVNPSPASPEDMTPAERRALARLKDGLRINGNPVS